MWQAKAMRRKDRALDEGKTMALLQAGEYGVLASAAADGVPLATPLSYVVLGGKLYFHCAQSGQKLGNIAAQPRVCFCVVGKTQPVFDNDFSTYYESAVVHGPAAVVEDDEEKRAALLALCEKYLPQHMDKAAAYADAGLAKTCVVRVEIEQLSGKAKKPKA